MKKIALLLCFTLIFGFTFPNNRVSAENVINSDIFLYASQALGGEKIDKYEGLSSTAVISRENSNISWDFEAAAGKYNLIVEYYPIDNGSSSSINRKFLFNGNENSVLSVNFARCWVDKLGSDGEFSTDSYENQITPRQIQAPKWLKTNIYNENSNNNESAVIELKDGKNNLEIAGFDDEIAFSYIRLVPLKEIKSYIEVSNEYKSAGYKKANNQKLVIEAEKSLYKSDCTLAPDYNRSTTNVSPNSPNKQLINIIGGANWNTVGQYIVWEADIKESGLYCISFKYKKDVNQGMSSYRRLYIDGEIPFAEANNIEFPYSADFKNLQFENSNEPYYFYLEKGKHEIKLEACLGDMASIAKKLDESIYRLNSIYRRIIVITSTSPDLYRDYEFDTVIPDVIEDLKKEETLLREIYDEWYALVGEKGSMFSTLDLMLETVASMHMTPENIAKKLSAFKTYIGSCGNLLINLRSSQLALDVIDIYSSDNTPTGDKTNFFKQLWFSIRATLSSFVIDYDKIGTIESEKKLDEVTVWVSGGRDQYEIVKNLTNEGSLNAKGVKANLRLTGAPLLSTIVAGIAPDIVLLQDGSTTIELALRGAIEPLDKYDGFDEIKSDYYEQSFIPVTFENHIYAIPNTMAFSVLFYRKDILENMNLQPPETWDDVTRIITILNKNNLEFGLPAGMDTYFAMLAQHGKDIYDKDGTSVTFDSQEGVDTFIRFTRYFTDYGQPLSYDVQNRFRTGEMPLVISDYSLFNALAVAAPEIADLWDFTLIPGTKKDDGSVNHTTSLSVSGTVMLKQCENKDAAWEFIKWWTSSEIQTDYGRSLESVLGASSRYAAANLKAFNNMPWTSAQKKVLLQQLNHSTALRQVPGDYLVTREFDNGFKLVVNEEKDPKDTILEKTKSINIELTAKRKEFGLKTAK